ncbi:MAG: DUF362 domain-containing protein [Chloroflexi bacterium]|nr:DUF362 domain-containing protein [Chloroflexota bacterium]
MNEKKPRRQFLWSLVAMGALAPLARRLLVTRKATVDDPTSWLYLPGVVTPPVSSAAGRVVHVHSTDATSWTGQASYWDFVNASKVNEMVNRGVMALTGTSTVANAWRLLIRDYQPGRAIAIKVSFNNSFNCGESQSKIDGLIEPVNAVISGLDQIGVARSDIWVYDATRALPARFVNKALSGIRFFDQECHEDAGYSWDPSADILFQPPTGVQIPRETLPNVLMNASYLINMPIMKGGHPAGGVSLGYKNHFGTVSTPAGLHPFINVVQGTARADYSPMVDFFKNSHIGGKTVLTIGDGLFASQVYNQAPTTWSTFQDKTPQSLFFSTDPVAIDCVMHDFVKAEMPDLPATANNYLRLASQAGQGVFESANPWTGSYAHLGYHKIDV